MPDMREPLPEACAVYVYRDENQVVTVSFYNDGYAEVRREANGRAWLHIIPTQEAWEIAARYAPQEKYQLEVPFID